MIEYIYFVKCDGCEDEPFYFFDKAKECAMSCLKQKPVITQVEVHRNDFGECVDSCDLGTIWTYEEALNRNDEAKPEVHVISKADFEGSTECDPEFDSLDNSLEPNDDFFFLNNNLSEDIKRQLAFKSNAEYDEFTKLCKEIGILNMKDIDLFMKETGATADNILDKLREYRAELGPDFKIEECQRKPIPEDMTIEQLIEEMEENEDEVECTWCNDLFPKDQCRKEVDLGYLCPRCEAAIKSRGETLTFRENNYWDFLDEEVEIPVDSDEEEPEESLFDEAESIEDVVDILVKDEEEAVVAYEEAQEKVDELLGEEETDAIKDLLDHVKEEELEHIDELESILTDEEEPSEMPVEESLEDSKDYRVRLGVCPECGTEEAFDHEAGLCLSCGFLL